MKVVVYTRFSDRPDASESESCEVQLSICRNYAEQKGWIILSENCYDDRARSGADEGREGLWAAIHALKKDDVLLVYRRDRLARDIYIAVLIEHEVERVGARIVAVQGDIQGEKDVSALVRNIIYAVADYERRMIAKRTSAALRYYQDEEKYIVSKILPFGFEPDPDRPGYMRESEREQRVISLARVLYEKEGYGVSTIVKKLKEGMYRSSLRSGTISVATVHSLIKKGGWVKSTALVRGQVPRPKKKNNPYCG